MLLLLVRQQRRTFVIYRHAAVSGVAADLLLGKPCSVHADKSGDGMGHVLFQPYTTDFHAVTQRQPAQNVKVWACYPQKDWRL